MVTGQFKAVFCVLFLLVLPDLAAPQDVSLRVLSDGNALEAPLRGASLSMSLQEADDPKPQDYVAAARADYRRLLTALYAQGYYGGTVSIKVDGREAATIAPLDAPRRIDGVEVIVTPGPRFRFGDTVVAPLPDGTQLPGGFAPGEPAQSDTIRSAVRASVDGWRAAGYAKARPSNQEIIARHPDQRLDVRVVLSPGPRLTFGPLSVSGARDVSVDAITRIAGLPQGSVYSPQEIDKAAQRLRQTGAFDSVAFTEAETAGADDTLAIDLQVQESKPRRFGFGLELSSVEGVKVSSFWMHRNAFGGAERFRLTGEIAGIGGGTGGVDYLLGAELGVPAIYGPDTNLRLSATLSREDEPDYLVDAAVLAAEATRILQDDLTAKIGIGLLAAREDRGGDLREYTLVTLPVGLTLDRRNSTTNATDGYYIDASATPFLAIRGAESGAQLYADARAYRSFGEDNRFVLAARGQLGSLIGANAETAPADFLFYSGGGGTVRGQGYKSLAGQSDGTGGLSFAGAQLEARFSVRENIDLVGFYDIGHVGRTATPASEGDWHAGIGLGVRYDTGIGPIRLDIGTPANGEDAFGSVQVYIGIGQAF